MEDGLNSLVILSSSCFFFVSQVVQHVLHMQTDTAVNIPTHLYAVYQHHLKKRKQRPNMLKQQMNRWQNGSQGNNKFDFIFFFL